MTVHLLYDGIRTFRKQVKAVLAKFPKTTVFHIHFHKRADLRTYFYLKKRGLQTVFTLPVLALSPKLRSLANKRNVTLVLSANTLSKKDFIKTDKLKNLTVIKTEDEQALEKRNLLVKNTCVDQPFSADVAELCLLGAPVYQCAFSSCLGKTLFVDLQGEVSFCPEHIEETRLGNLFDETPIFERAAFLQVLEKQIEKRERCKENCPSFSACRGGCAIVDTCNSFKSVWKETAKKIDDVVLSKKSLVGEDKQIATAILRAAAKGNLINKN